MARVHRYFGTAEEKPPVSARIDWGHPLSRGLQFAVIWNEKMGGDIVNYATMEIGTTTHLGHTKYGWSNRADNLNILWPARPQTYSSIGSFTVLMRGQPQGSGVDSRSLWRMQSGNSIFHVGAGKQAGIAGVANKFVVVERSDAGAGLAGYSSDTTINGDTVRITYGFTKTLATGDYQFYFNGEEDGTGDGSITDVIHTASTLQLFRSSSATFRGDHEWVYTWSRALTHAEIRSVEDHPYQMFLPYSRRAYNTAAAPAAEVQAAFMTTNTGYWG